MKYLVTFAYILLNLLFITLAVRNDTLAWWLTAIAIFIISALVLFVYLSVPKEMPDSDGESM